MTKYLTEAWGRGTLFRVEVQAVMVGSLDVMELEAAGRMASTVRKQKSKMLALISLARFYAVWDSSPWTGATHVPVPMEVGGGGEVICNCSCRHCNLLAMDARKSGPLQEQQMPWTAEPSLRFWELDFVLRCFGFWTWSASMAITVLIDGHSNLMVGLGRKWSQESS